MLTIVRSFIMYEPLKFFITIGFFPFLSGLIIGIRFLVYMSMGQGNGHIQSLILASTLLLLGFMIWVVGFQADIIAANRKILEDIQYHVREIDYRYHQKRK